MPRGAISPAPTGNASRSAGHQSRRVPAARRADIAGPVSPRTLCTSVTAALEAGVPSRVVEEAASHAEPTTTMRYNRDRAPTTHAPPTLSPPTSPAPLLTARSRPVDIEHIACGGVPRRLIGMNAPGDVVGMMEADDERARPDLPARDQRAKDL
jgi:hypothetical protein